MPCRFDGVVVPTDIRIPINVCVVAPVCVQATPPADAALPPIKLPLIVKLFPDAALFTLIPINPVVVFEKVLVAVWNTLFPVIVQSVFPPTTNIPFAIVAIVLLKKSEIKLFVICIPLLLFETNVVVPNE